MSGGAGSVSAGVDQIAPLYQFIWREVDHVRFSGLDPMPQLARTKFWSALVWARRCRLKGFREDMAVKALRAREKVILSREENQGKDGQ